MSLLKRYPLIFLLPLYISWHLLVLLNLEPSLLLTFPEELQRGTIAKEIMEGLKAPLISYMPDSYSGGSLVIGVLASLFFSFLGTSLFALKLVPITLFSLALIFWFLAIKNAFNEKTAIYFSLLYTFAPFAFVQFCQSHMGDHPETILFTGLSIFLFFKIIYPPSEKKLFEWLPYLLLGFVAGFGIWFAYIFSLTVLCIFIFWFFHNPLFWMRKKFLVFIIGFFIGFSPWIFINAAHMLNSLNIHGKPAWDFFTLDRLFEFFIHYQNTVPFRFLTSFAPPWMHAPSFLWKATNITFITLYFIPFYFAFFVGFEKHLRSFKFKLSKPVDFFILYTLIFFFCSQLSTFRNIRFMIPFFPFFFFFVALALERMTQSKSARGKMIQAAILNLIVLLSIYLNITNFSPPHARAALNAKGYNYFYLGHWPDKSTHAICKSSDSCLKHYPLFVKSLSPIDLHTFSLALGTYIHDERALDDKFERDVIQAAALIPDRLKPYFFYTLGARVVPQVENLGQAMDHLSFVEEFSPENSKFVLRGLLDQWGDDGGIAFTAEGAQKLKSVVPPSMRPYYWMSVGQRTIWHLLDVRQTAVHLKHEIRRILEFIPSRFHHEFLAGVGKTLALSSYVDLLPQSLSELETWPADWQPSLFEGVGMAIVSAEHLDSNPLMEQNFAPEITSESFASIQRGKHEFLNLFTPGKETHAT